MHERSWKQIDKIFCNAKDRIFSSLSTIALDDIFHHLSGIRITLISHTHTHTYVHHKRILSQQDNMVKLQDLPQFAALTTAASQFNTDEKLHLRNLVGDAARSEGLVATHENASRGNKIVLDYSRQQVVGDTMETLFDMADQCGLVQKMEEMRCGKRINETENRMVLHHALRMPKGYDFGNCETGSEILAEVHSVLDAMSVFVDKVRSGEHTGASGKAIKNVVAIGIGGSQLGPEFAFEALRADKTAAAAAEGRKLCFLANVDPVDFELCTRDLDPEETMIIVISKTFTTAEVIYSYMYIYLKYIL